MDPTTATHVELRVVNTEYNLERRMTVLRSSTWFDIKIRLARMFGVGETSSVFVLQHHLPVLAIRRPSGAVRMIFDWTVEDTLQGLPGWQEGDALRVRMYVGDAAMVFRSSAELWAEQDG